MKNQIHRLIRRKISDTVKLLPTSIPPLLRRIYASRGVSSLSDIELSIEGILPWQQLSGIKSATNMLYNAFCDDMHIAVVGDFDVDGAASVALSVLCLWDLGYYNISYLVPNRFTDGYGLSPEIVERLCSYGAQMIMTVDNGISSLAGIERANQLGIRVLVTDHHLPGKILPNAEAIVNPNLHYCEFPSKALSGVGVTFYLMIALRTLLRDKEWFTIRNIAIPNILQYLDLVALGTISDVVPFDNNNRILIWQGLNRIRAGKCRPGIIALLEIANRNISTLVTSDLGFIIGPRLNAAGRLDDMSISVSLLLCNNLNKARILANRLDTLNRIRKKISYNMQTEALNMCNALKYSTNKLPNGIAIYHPKWHQGIIGIVASCIKEQFHRPVIAFAQIGNGILKGSGRSIQGLHILDILDHLNTLYPKLIIKFGGHAMAVGLLLEERQFSNFQYSFNELISQHLDSSLLHNEVISDGTLLSEEMTIEVAQMLYNAGPWGPMFPEPSFDGHFYLLQQRLIHKRHLNVTVEPIAGGPLLNGIMFDINTEIWPNSNVHKVELVYKLSINEFFGHRKLQIIINNIWPI